MATWRVARGLNTLLAQVNEIAPGRSVASDGSIGDPAHAAGVSDHNPDASGVVRARDFTHDPAKGADMHTIGEALRQSRDRRIKYVIFNRRLFSATVAPTWTWRPYSGSNPHDKHMHVSTVADDVIADGTGLWQIGDGMPTLDEITKAVREQLRAALSGPFYDPGHLGVPAGTTRAGMDWHVYQRTDRIERALAAARADLAAAMGRDPVDEEALAAILWAKLAEQELDVIERVLRQGMDEAKLVALAERLRGEATTG